MGQLYVGDVENSNLVCHVIGGFVSLFYWHISEFWLRFRLFAFIFHSKSRLGARKDSGAISDQRLWIELHRGCHTHSYISDPRKT